MPPLVPNRLLFKLAFPIHRCAAGLNIDGNVAKWPAVYRLPDMCLIDGERPFAEVSAAWNDNGLFIGCRVEGKRRPPQCDPEKFWKSDHVRVMTDMRDTRNIRRATRFCQQFYLMPTGGGPHGTQAVAGRSLVHRATQDAPVAGGDPIPISSKAAKTGYSLTAHLPSGVLNGFDPAENPRIGLLVMVEDVELGQQSLTVGDELNWWIDPSMWPVGELSV